MEENGHIWTAEQFHLGSRTTHNNGMELIDVMTKMKIKKTDIIVDMGCGNGELTQMISKVIPHKNIYGFDSLSTMIKYAEERHSGKTIDYFVADISTPWEKLEESVRVLEGKVDIAFSNFVLHLVDCKSNAFRNISRLLKHEGYLLINVPPVPDLNEIEYSEEEKRQNLIYLNSQTKEQQISQYHDLIAENGLQLLDEKEFFGEWRFDSKEDLLKFIAPIPGILAPKYLKDNIDDSDKKQLINHYSSVIIRALTSKNFQKCSGAKTTDVLDFSSFYLYRIRFICKIKK